jgi:ketosteroid isomerase-like protein
MTTMSATDAQIRELGRRWVEAEQGGDDSALQDMSTDDFTMVGPAGFVLDRSQWLQRYRSGELVTRTLIWDQLAVRDYGDTAVVIGVHTQQASYQGKPVDGAFRATHIAIRREEKWLLAGIHLSPIGGPPRFAAARTDAE